MRNLRRANERGHGDHGWLDTWHTFSFADYYDPHQMGFRSLRVINEDRVAAGSGFGMHPHRDMEIVTYVLSGELTHRDSMGHGEVIRAGELQRMTAGTGIRHSEHNEGPGPVHLYQIWLLPAQQGLRPSYEQLAMPPEEKRGRWRLAASPSGESGSLTIHQDARIYLAELQRGEELRHGLAPGRHAWLQVLRGRLSADGESLAAGDGLAVGDEPELTVRANEGAELMLFDLA